MPCVEKNHVISTVALCIACVGGDLVRLSESLNRAHWHHTSSGRLRPSVILLCLSPLVATLHGAPCTTLQKYLKREQLACAPGSGMTIVPLNTRQRFLARPRRQVHGRIYMDIMPDSRHGAAPPPARRALIGRCPIYLAPETCGSTPTGRHCNPGTRFAILPLHRHGRPRSCRALGDW